MGNTTEFCDSCNNTLNRIKYVIYKYIYYFTKYSHDVSINSENYNKCNSSLIEMGK